MFDACVVGSGPGGVFAAYGLRGRRVLMLDAGVQPPAQPALDGNLYDVRRSGPDLDRELIGDDLRGLEHIFTPPASLKLKSPGTAYILDGAERLTPVVSETFRAAISLAQGGLANAWGAGVYRFTDTDLRGFPVTAAELAPFYDEVGQHIGISGAGDDDLRADFGDEPQLQAPVRLSRNVARIHAKYQARRARFQAAGVRLGHARLAVLTAPHKGRAAYAYRNLEFFQAHDPAIYNPAFTLREMIAAHEITYEPGWIVTRYEETESGVRVHALALDGQRSQVFEARKLLLAAGAINSARIVLASSHDFATRLPLSDNPIAVFPLIDPRAIGLPLGTHDAAVAQLNVIVEEAGRTLQGSIYGSTGALRSDLIANFPLPLRSGVAFARVCAPALTLLMLFYPETSRDTNYLQLRPDGALRAAYQWTPDTAMERRLCGLWRQLGVVCLPQLIQHPAPGGGIHYAGTLPMAAWPGRYMTYPDGRLHGTRHVYSCDGAVFPALPAKNLTYTIMALALRTATRLRGALR
ncbi:MAG: GMC family oxidoreductase [Bryobacterales bacterium]|nr:GMC family oxidoreductase [Bryobacterales bacterium]